MNYKYFTAIGSRQTPIEILEKLYKITNLLTKNNWIMRSGGAPGADSAAESGVANNNKEIYLPWKGFNKNKSNLYTISNEALELAQKFHPAWHRLSQGAQKLHARNCYQVLGLDLNTPSVFVLCWHNNSGGTLQACRIADFYSIPIINLINENWKEKLINILN